MIAWDPNERPGVEEALAQESWAPLLNEERGQNNARNADVKRGNVGFGLGVKRVRLLSPGEEDTRIYDPSANMYSSLA